MELEANEEVFRICPPSIIPHGGLVAVGSLGQSEPAPMTAPDGRSVQRMGHVSSSSS
jgi:hypothetical protein